MKTRVLTVASVLALSLALADPAARAAGPERRLLQSGPRGGARGAAAPTFASADAAQRAAVQKLTGRARPRLAVTYLEAAREAFNDAEGLAPLLTVACWKIGDLGCLDETGFDAEVPAALTLRHLKARADALRWTGDGEAAAALRHEVLTEDLSTVGQALAWANLARDLRLTDHEDRVWDAADHAEAAEPDLNAVFALRIELLLDEGDLDGAMIESAMAEQRGCTGSALDAARMRVVLELGAEQDLTDATVRHARWNGNLDYAVRLFVAYRRLGMHERARGVLDSTFFRFADELWWPHLIALSALNHYDLGQIEEGRAELARSVDLARDNRIVAFVQTVIAREHAGEAGRHRTP